MIRRAPVSVDVSDVVADIMTASRPDEPQDPVYSRWWLERPMRPDSIRVLALWESEGRTVAYTEGGHLSWHLAPERFTWMELYSLPEVVAGPLLGEVQDGFIEQALEDEPNGLNYQVWEDAEREIASIEKRGFVRDRLSKAWELDLVRHGERLLAEREKSRGRMAAEGVTLATLAADQDPDKLPKLLRLINLSQRDIPTTVPIHDETMEETVRWLEAPVLRHDRFWIAREGDEIVGLSYLQYPPQRGNVWTGYTASLPSHRGRGIARAVKMETLGQAVDLGVTRVRTDNDEENAPMLHINEQMGYEPMPGFVSLLKRVET